MLGSVGRCPGASRAGAVAGDRGMEPSLGVSGLRGRFVGRIPKTPSELPIPAFLTEWVAIIEFGASATGRTRGEPPPGSGERGASWATPLEVSTA